MSKSVDQYIRELMNAFESRNPEVLIEVTFLDGVYYFTVDYGIKNLPSALQANARSDINKLLTALKPLKLQTELRLGDV